MVRRVGRRAVTPPESAGRVAGRDPAWSTEPVEGFPGRADPVLVVDGANVVGSRPDGWWRDRPGAASRLHDRLVAAEEVGRVVLVLEGGARGGVPEVDDGRVKVVHAPGSGDDAIVEEAAAAVQTGSVTTVVTADRELVGRVRAVGAEAERPGRLLARLDVAAAPATAGPHTAGQTPPGVSP